jgi:hypothetical protein
MKTTKLWNVAVTAVLVLGFAGTSHAQRAVSGMGAPVSARPATSSGLRPNATGTRLGTAVARPARRPPAHRMGATDFTTGDFGNSGSFGFGFGGSFGLNQNLMNLLNSVPGLGFDFEHLAAVNADLGEKALIDPVTQGELALAVRLAQVTPQTGFVPWVGGGYGYYPGYYQPEQEANEEPPAPQQPQVIVVQAPSANQQQAAQSQTAESEPPLPDVGEFTLVLLNGKQISAVAFSRQGGQLVYITQDGGRESVAVSDVDVAATRKVNEEHGTPLKLSL